MKRGIKILFPGVLLLAAASIAVAVDPGAGKGAIHVREVAPAEARVGDIVTAYGDNLIATRVLEVYLTDGKSDYKTEILEQAEHLVRFRLPAFLPTGKLRIVVFSDEQMMLEQPAFVKVVYFPGPSTGA